MHSRALNANAASVDQSNFGQPGLVGRVYVLLDYGWNVTRCERVQVERAFDGNAVSHSPRV